MALEYSMDGSDTVVTSPPRKGTEKTFSRNSALSSTWKMSGNANSKVLIALVTCKGFSTQFHRGITDEAPVFCQQLPETSGRPVAI